MSLDERMRTQRAEFDAAHELSQTYRLLPAIVDDDYPAARSRYEGAAYRFVSAAIANGRVAATAPRVSAADAVIQGLRDELDSACAKFGPFNSAHEGFAILNEEFDELKAHVWMNQKRRDLPAMRKEALQVAAMALRFALDVCDETRGRK